MPQKNIKDEVVRLKNAEIPECRLHIDTVDGNSHHDFVVIFAGEDYFVAREYGRRHPESERRIPYTSVSGIATHVTC